MSVKLYRHENGQTVGAALHVPSQEYGIVHNNGYLEHIGKERFLKTYTPLTEAPEVGSTAWAVMMVEKGHKITNPTLKDIFIYYDGEVRRGGNGVIDTVGIISFRNDWQLYAPPKIIECLPHDFVPGQEVLVCRKDSNKWYEIWRKQKFKKYDKRLVFPFVTENYNKYSFCLPYIGNEHLEDTHGADGEHGAVPRGYVPPHVPKLGDDDYWQVGDKIINLYEGKTYTIFSSGRMNKTRTFSLQEKGHNTQICIEERALNGGHYSGALHLRIWYHVHSYVKKDGTVHEHRPTRPHKIIDTDTDGA